MFEYITINPEVKKLWEKEELSQELKDYLEQAVIEAKKLFPSK